MRTSDRDTIPPGTLEMLILQVLQKGRELHGFEIAQAIRDGSAAVLRAEEGSLYPALQRLLAKGWVTASWGSTDENRRARYYRLTRLGRRQLPRQVDAYHRVSRAIEGILQSS